MEFVFTYGTGVSVGQRRRTWGAEQAAVNNAEKGRPTRAKGRCTDHLARGHAHGLDTELAAAHVEQVLQVRAEQVDDEHVVQTLLPKVVHVRDARCRAGVSGVWRGRECAGDARVLLSVRYERYSSRSCGASDLRGSYRRATVSVTSVCAARAHAQT
jgi:hypothetical protein